MHMHTHPCASMHTHMHDTRTSVRAYPYARTYIRTHIHPSSHPACHPSSQPSFSPCTACCGLVYAAVMEDALVTHEEKCERCKRRIVGVRHHRRGTFTDLCPAHYDALTELERAVYDPIERTPARSRPSRNRLEQARSPVAQAPSPLTTSCARWRSGPGPSCACATGT